MTHETFSDVVRETIDLLRREAHPRTGTIALAPETVALLEALQATSRPARISEPESESPEAIAPTPAMPEVVTQDSPAVPEDAAEALAQLAADVSACTRCSLCKTRTQTVFGDGSPTADLVFVGEAPGFYEDRDGVPFVGKAGKLLTDIIVKGMRLRREDVYICNVIKCRPPENRDPSQDEKRQCEPYLVRQLELVRPKVICALGGHAAKTLLKTEESTGRLRGKWHFYRGIPLRVTYHPSYLLRSPGEKGKTWDDIQEVMKVLRGEESPTPPEGLETPFTG